MPKMIIQGPWLKQKIFQKLSNDTLLERVLKYEQNGAMMRCLRAFLEEILTFFLVI